MEGTPVDPRRVECTRQITNPAQKLSRETIQHLHATTDGWAAGLVLMLEGVKRGIEPQLLGRLTPEEIFDYFAKELFDRTEKEVQEFFLKTAFLSKMIPRVAEELTDVSHADRILSTLSKNNYFTEKRFDIEPIYQYHPLFREFLLSRAKQTFSPETILILLHRAAVLLEEDGQTEAAVSLFRDAGQWDRLTQLILKRAPLMVEQGRNQTLIEWLKSLPKEILENHPWLLYWMGVGVCRLRLNLSLSRSCFEESFKQLKNY